MFYRSSADLPWEKRGVEEERVSAAAPGTLSRQGTSDTCTALSAIVAAEEEEEDDNDDDQRRWEMIRRKQRALRGLFNRGERWRSRLALFNASVSLLFFYFWVFFSFVGFLFHFSRKLGEYSRGSTEIAGHLAKHSSGTRCVLSIRSEGP